MKTRVFTIFLVIIFSIVFLVFYKGLQNSNIYQPKIVLDKEVPIFNAKIFGNSDQISSKEIFDNDQFYLMNVWASWCVPCRDEHKFLMSLGKKKDLRIIGLNYKDKKQNAINFLNELNNPYDLVLDDKDGILAIEWGAYGVPESFLIFNNKIIKKIIGPIDQTTMKEINELIQ